MTSRARYEHQIKMLDTWSGNDFYTTEQLGEIRDQMIRDAWFSHKLNRENRKRRAA